MYEDFFFITTDVQGFGTSIKAADILNPFCMVTPKGKTVFFKEEIKKYNIKNCLTVRT